MRRVTKLAALRARQVGRAIRAFAGYRKTTTPQTSLLFLYAKAINSSLALAT
jgi:hypothetical protein